MTSMNRWLVLVLAFLAMPAFAVIQDGDIQFHEDGEVVYIDDPFGAGLHFTRPAAASAPPLKFKATVDDPALKLTHSTCQFTSTHHHCRMELHLTNVKNKVYGVHTLTLTEVGGAASSVTFKFGVVPAGAPKAFRWGYKNTEVDYTARPFLLVNATLFTLIYQNQKLANGEKSYRIVLPRNSFCYVDNNSIDSADPDSTYYDIGEYHNGFEDIVNPNKPIYNGAWIHPPDLNTCAGAGKEECASGKWSSITIGVANIGSTNLGAYGLKPGELKLSSLGSAWVSGTSITWYDSYNTNHSALLQIQGTIDGRPFDVDQAAPNIMEIKSAPPCSNNLWK